MVPVDQGLAAHRLTGGDVILNDRPEDGEPALFLHAVSFRFPLFRPHWHSTAPSAKTTRLHPVSEFDEVADRVWVARYVWCEVNVTLVEGSSGLLVVDTHGSTDAAREVLADLRRISKRPVVVVVNTHAHFDHCYGNGLFKQEYADLVIYAHDESAARLRTAPATGGLPDGVDAQHAEQVRATTVVAPDRTLSSVAVIDLGDRIVELVHPGAAHTAGDLVCRIGDADVLLAGDLVEESGPPAYGPDSYPLEWPRALDLVLDLIGPDTLVVPGHGATVGREFVEDQRTDIGVVAETIRDLAGRGVSVHDALESAEWPFEKASLGHAVRRGYEQLPRAQKRLPLI